MNEKANLKELRGELVELKEKEEKLTADFKKLVNQSANLVLEMVRKPVEECKTQELKDNAQKLNSMKKEILSLRERIQEIEKILGAEQ